ncbi:putative beta-glucosidase [Mycena sanguinolenta]|uniref:Probable beta-glucosidase G n=1 Tax=Mycena sanguinolenta TaxID=230812 RepID=A0A8H6YP38_9AGAR|nr:putative beta-glucosidase [Mycena sanguinolenta]
MGFAFVAAVLLAHSSLVSSYEFLYPRLENYTGPFANGGTWTKGFAQAKALVDQMTIEEKVNITTGYTGKCVGFTGEVPRLNLRGLCLQVRTMTNAAHFTEPHADIWRCCDVARMVQADRDVESGFDGCPRCCPRPGNFTTKELTFGKNSCYLYPSVNFSPTLQAGPCDRRSTRQKSFWWQKLGGFRSRLVRFPLSKKTFVLIDLCRYLNGVASYLTVTNAQEQGVISCAKHFIGYEQETFRNPYGLPDPAFPPFVQSPISSNFDDRTAHEVGHLLKLFGQRSERLCVLMNLVDDIHSCADDHTLNYLLKTELGFQGTVISDWGGTWDTESSAIGGLDVSMPGTGFNGLLGDFFGDQLVALVQNGSVSEARLDDMAIRTLTPILQYQDLSTYPEPSFDVRDLTIPTNNVRRDHYKVIRAIGQEALTLVKNNRQSGGGLPFPAPSSMGSLAVIGEDAGPSPYGATSCGDTGNDCLIENNGTMTIGGGSGWAYPPYTIDPLAAINAFVAADGPDINSHLENWDLAAAAFPGQSVGGGVAVNNNTIVVMHVPGPVLVEEWIDHENVTAVLVAHLPGQESGNALVPVLWGETSPSGKMPYTVGKQVSDWPPHTISSDPVISPQANFTEKLMVDYKWFDAKNITPRFEFGFGLSYTTFKFGALSIAQTFKADNTSVQPTAEPFAKQSDPGSSMYDILYTATIDITNVGAVQGAEVAQLYISFPPSAGEPPFILRGFDKLNLAPGQKETATFELRRKDISVWDVVNQQWEIPQGTFTISVGASSRDLRSSIKHTFA